MEIKTKTLRFHLILIHNQGTTDNNVGNDVEHRIPYSVLVGFQAAATTLEINEQLFH